ncbi:MAG: recombinase [Paenibacillus sp.]|jgi:site-specific DNA recombinase|nr:recombinase [Paenibacillus sp.]
MTQEAMLQQMQITLENVKKGRPTRAVIYSRYSSNNQRDESIEAQVRAAEEFAKRNNLQIVKIYCDKALTGTTDKRPGFLQMIEDSDKSLFDVVLVHKLDRFSRDKFDSAHYKRILKKNRVKLISVLENLDDSPESVILESVLEGMAEYYCKNLAREVMKGMKETALQCKHTGGLPPIGYSVDPATKKYIINDQEKGIVQIVFSMYLNGYGYDQILLVLNEKGYRGRTGRPIGKNTILEMLKNEKYTGTYVFNLTDGKDAFGQRNSHRKKPDDEVIRIEGGMPAIISSEDFLKVQEKVSANRRAPASYKAKEMYMLSGLTVCGECLKNLGQKFSMMGNVKYSGRSKLKYVTYRCGNRDRTKECRNKELRKEYIEDYVLHELERRVFNEESISLLVKQLNEHQSKATKQSDAEAEVMKTCLAYVDSQISHIVSAVSKGFTQPTFLQKMTELEEDKARLEVNLAELQTAGEQPSSVSEDTLRELFASFREYVTTKNIPEIKKFISSYVDKVIIYNDHVEVIFKLDAAGISVDGTEFDAFAATVAKKELFGSREDAM